MKLPTYKPDWRHTAIVACTAACATAAIVAYFIWPTWLMIVLWFLALTGGIYVIPILMMGRGVKAELDRKIAHAERPTPLPPQNSA